MKLLSRVQLFATLRTVVHQAPQSMGFSRQEYWSGLPYPSPGDHLDLGTKPMSPSLADDSFPLSQQGNPNTSKIAIWLIDIHQIYLN